MAIFMRSQVYVLGPTFQGCALGIVVCTVQQLIFLGVEPNHLKFCRQASSETHP